ncbi:MAG: SUMF1/EgtB/PvdO family nonheme iron enzyme [Myxococcales bacterium]|nr:SUMF1/EgtB/PvdO family nonheme iron enzyme [Myxococcales bacterium]
MPVPRAALVLATSTTLEPASASSIDAGSGAAARLGTSVATSPCGEMVHVHGDYCPTVEHKCLAWLDPPGDRYEHFRCARYARPATCKAPRRSLDFCIARTEEHDPGTLVPVNRASWTEATRICRAQGARLCTASEWQFACEGEEMRPYAYGFERDSSACNVDIAAGLGRVGRLVDHRVAVGSKPRCTSAFGVFDMAGNVDEWVTLEGLPRGTREVMKGSWWIPGKHTCRAQQAGHGDSYGGTETGVRCCRDSNATLASR